MLTSDPVQGESLGRQGHTRRGDRPRSPCKSLGDAAEVWGGVWRNFDKVGFGGSGTFKGGSRSEGHKSLSHMGRLGLCACLTLLPLLGPKVAALMWDGSVSAGQNNVPLRATLKVMLGASFAPSKYAHTCAGQKRATLRTCILK